MNKWNNIFEGLDVKLMKSQYYIKRIVKPKIKSELEVEIFIGLQVQIMQTTDAMILTKTRIELGLQ